MKKNKQMSFRVANTPKSATKAKRLEAEQNKFHKEFIIKQEDWDDLIGRKDWKAIGSQLTLKR